MVRQMGSYPVPQTGHFGQATNANDTIPNVLTIQIPRHLKYEQFPDALPIRLCCLLHRAVHQLSHSRYVQW